MGIFARLSALFKSNVNDLINKTEDPEKMLTQMLLEMQSQLVEAVSRRGGWPGLRFRTSAAARGAGRRRAAAGAGWDSR